MSDYIKTLIASYPRKKMPLPLSQQAIYEQEYLISREDKTFVTKITSNLEAWMHRMIAYKKGQK